MSAILHLLSNERHSLQPVNKKKRLKNCHWNGNWPPQWPKCGVCFQMGPLQRDLFFEIGPLKRDHSGFGFAWPDDHSESHLFKDALYLSGCLVLDTRNQQNDFSCPKNYWEYSFKRIFLPETTFFVEKKSFQSITLCLNAIICPGNLVFVWTRPRICIQWVRLKSPTDLCSGCSFFDET